MPKGATLINTARAEVINEEELAKIMVERPDFKYYSDIEPKDKTLFSGEYKNRFFYTPKKMGAQTSEANINAGIAAAEQIVDFIKTGNKKFQVNK
jgi:D-3-phosphoglycerate dehydrogenase